MLLKWDPEHVYFYLVSFIALILLLVGTVSLTRTAIATLAPVYDHYDPFAYQNLAPWEEQYGAEVIAAEKERFASINRENHTRGLIRDLAGSLALIVTALPLYLYHWRRIPRLEQG